MNPQEVHSTQNLVADYAKNAELPTQGRLNQYSSKTIIDQLHSQKFSGRLTLFHRDKRKKLWFYQGEIFRVQSNLAPELFGQMMVEKSWFNEADLKRCLDLQKRAKVERTLGDLVQELYGVRRSEVDLLESQQKVRGILQAMTWEEGEFEITEIILQRHEEIQLRYTELLYSIRALLQTQKKDLGGLFKIVTPWTPKAGTVNLAQSPVWSILAGCRMKGADGILTIRKQNKLHEIVIKHGVPLTLYEGTFGQPRQTILVRQTSAEHERFFVEQVFKLFAFSTGSAHFRPIGEGAQMRSDEVRLEKGDNTCVMADPSRSGPNAELTAHFSVQPKGFLAVSKKFCKKVFKSLSNF